MHVQQRCVIFPTDDGVGVVSHGCRRCGDDQGASTYIDHLIHDRHMVVTKRMEGVTYLVHTDEKGRPITPDLSVA